VLTCLLCVMVSKRRALFGNTHVLLTCILSVFFVPETFGVFERTAFFGHERFQEITGYHFLSIKSSIIMMAQDIWLKALLKFMLEPIVQN